VVFRLADLNMLRGGEAEPVERLSTVVREHGSVRQENVPNRLQKGLRIAILV